MTPLKPNLQLRTGDRGHKFTVSCLLPRSGKVWLTHAGKIFREFPSRIEGAAYCSDLEQEALRLAQKILDEARESQPHNPSRELTDLEKNMMVGRNCP